MRERGRGRTLEVLLDRWHRSYRDRGLAFIVRQEVPTQVVGRRLRRCSKSLPDYMGLVMVYGRKSSPVMFDAKETHRDRWPIGSLEDHQRAAMVEFARYGGLPWVYVAYMPTEERSRRDFAVPLSQLTDLELPRTIPIDVMASIGCEIDPDGDGWLPIVAGWVGSI